MQNGEIKEAFRLIYEYVLTTYGADGKSVATIQPNGLEVTKDGAKAIASYVPTSRAGRVVHLAILQSLSRVLQGAGDGTTTSVVLAYKLYESLTDDPLSFRALSKALKKELKELHKHIDSMKLDAVNTKRLLNTTSNGIDEIVKTLSKGEEVLNTGGSIILRKTPEKETYIKNVEGYYLDLGISDLKYLGNSHEVTVDGAVVVLTDTPVSAVNQFKTKIDTTGEVCIPMLDYIFGELNTNLVIFAPSYSTEVSTSLQMYITAKYPSKRLIPMVLETGGGGIQAFNDLVDLSALTGAKIIRPTEFKTLGNIQQDSLGHLVKLYVGWNSHSALVPDASQAPVMQKWCETLDIDRKKYNSLTTQYKMLEDRLRRFKLNSMIVFVGGFSDSMRDNLYDLYEDSLNSLTKAVTFGTVPGGGKAICEFNGEYISNKITGFPVRHFKDTSTVEDSIITVKDSVSCAVDICLTLSSIGVLNAPE